MGFFRDLFSRPITAQTLKGKLDDIERERRKAMMEMRRLGAQQTELISQVKQFRKDGNTLEVDYVWEDLKAAKAESALVRKEARILNLEGIALKRYIRGLERLERSGDRDSAKRLIERIRSSGLDSRLAAADLNDKEYLSELQNTLDEVGLADVGLDELREDPEKAKFLAQIDEINAAEDRGQLDLAVEKESELKSRLEAEKTSEE